MDKLKRKLNNQTGASITYALLIFLVCAVVGSSVLVAGTAASGRMSQMAEMDQRYYSVNSAARLLIDIMQRDKIVYEMPESDESDNDTDDEQNEGEEDGTSSTKADSCTFYVNGEKVTSTLSAPLALDIAMRVINMPSDSKSEAIPLSLSPGLTLEGSNLDITGNLIIDKKKAESSADLEFEIKDEDGLYAIRAYFTNRTPSSQQFDWVLDHIESARWDQSETASPQSSTEEEQHG